jgi:hypothetical protein
MDDFLEGAYEERYEDDLEAFRERELDEDAAAGEFDEYIARCPACGDPIDYCQGHGEIGDPVGFAILAKHDDDDHSECSPIGCPESTLFDDGRWPTP